MQAQDPREYSRRAKTPGVCAEVAEAQSPGVYRDSEASPWYVAKDAATQENRASQTFWVKGIEPETGEILPFIQDKQKLIKKPDPRETRVERWALLSFVRQLIPQSRTAICLRFRQKGADTVDVWKSKDHGSTHYSNLQTCGSVWACPVCAAKVSERRKVEVKHAIDQHQAAGGFNALFTFTFSHGRLDDLGRLRSSLSKAHRWLTSHRTYKAIMADMGEDGTIRALEVTHGDNGWHPHLHVVVFYENAVDLDSIRARTFSIWSKACEKFGLGLPNETHGVRVDGAEKAASYVSKGAWGLESELTKSHIKKSKKGRSPFDLLRSYAYDDDKQAGALFIEYVKAFHRAEQLRWSPGLKDRFDVKSLSDEEIAAVHDDKALLLGQITIDQWRAVLALDRKWQARANILELARSGWEPVEHFINALVSEYQKIKREKDNAR